MFSHLSRGYGTWKGIAKLEKPESATSNGFSSEDLILPPINKEKQHLYDATQLDHLCRVPRDDVRLPDVVPQSESLPLPKTYSTKSGALLLYSEGCFVPGSRKLKKRPRLKKRKEKRLQTLNLTSLVMEYKKNECDPLLLAHLWHKANNSARDLRPGFSPQRYLDHLGYTTLDEDSWKRLVETGSLKSLGTLEDDKLLPLLFKDHKFGEKLLRQRPQPYTTMSLPPISPSNSMLGSFTFYKHGMSTGAASMVSMNSESHDDHLSAKTVDSFIESLSDRLAEVESQSGFKQNYESLSPKEKEDLLTQLLVDITLHNQGELAPVSPGSTTDFPSVAMTVSDLADTKSSKSLKSISKSSVFSSVCSLPPIGSNEVAQPTDLAVSGGFKDQAPTEEIPSDNLSSSSFVSGLTEGDLTVGVDGINIEIADNTFDLDSRHDSCERNTDLSLTSDGNTSEQMLIEALGIQDGDSDDEFADEIKSGKSLDHRSPNKSESENTSVTDNDAIMMESVAQQENLDQDGTGCGDDGSSDHAAGLIGVTVTEHNGHLETQDHDNTSLSDVDDDDDGGVVVGDDGGGVDDGGVVVGDDGGGGVDDGGVVVGDGGGGGDDDDGGDDGVGGAVCVHSGVDDGVRSDNGHSGEETRNQTESNAANEDPKTQHISLSNLQDEARLVVEQVLLRPQSGRLFSQDAQLASGLLMERMEQLLGHVSTDDIRVRSADPRKLRPLGQPRNCEMDKMSEKRLSKNERRLRSAGPTVALRTYRNQTEETTLPYQDEKQNPSELPELVSSEEGKTCQETEDGALKDNEKEITLDDIVLSADEVKEPATQLPEISSSQRDSLPVKDLTTAEEEVKETDKTTEKKEKVKKGKKGIKIKKGNVAKGKRKKKSDLQSEKQTEPPKTPPFRAGLVPEQKPPKGLKPSEDLRPSEANTQRNDTDFSETKAMATVEEVVELEKPADISTDLQQNLETETRVDSETGEIEEHGETPSVPESGPSLPEIASTLGETPSPHEMLRSPREETPSPRVETPSLREKTREPVSPQAAVVEEAESPAREPSPEVNVEVDERAQRANARVKQRAAAAERRRQDVERKRREREEARRKGQEEEARLEQLRQEAEGEMAKRAEERKIKKQQEACERRRVEAGEKEHARQERLVAERQKATREEWKRKKELLLSQRRLEEEMRMEREQIERQLEEERRHEYEARIAHLADEERERLMEERRIEEERIKKEIEEERLKREEERRRVLEERHRMEEEMAALQERQWARQLFLEGLLKDYQNLLLEQRTTRAFTFSYFDVLPWAKDIWSDLKGTPTRSTRPTSLQTVCEDEENEEEQAT